MEASHEKSFYERELMELIKCKKKKKKKRGRMGTTPVQLEMLYISWKLTRANDR